MKQSKLSAAEKLRNSANDKTDLVSAFIRPFAEHSANQYITGTFSDNATDRNYEVSRMACDLMELLNKNDSEKTQQLKTLTSREFILELYMCAMKAIFINEGFEVGQIQDNRNPNGYQLKMLVKW